MNYTNYILIFINILFQILSFAIIARIILSWIRTPISPSISKVLFDTTEPILSLARKITPNIGMLDFSPLVALIGLDLIKWLLMQILM